MNLPPRHGWLRVVAEGGLIVASILLALAVDAWWAGVQEARRSEELIADLLLEFETTQGLMDSAIQQYDRLLATMDSYFLDAHSPTAIPVDSLKLLVNAALVPVDFEPALSTYRGASTSGELSLIQSRELVEAFAEFDLAMEGVAQRNRVWLDWYYLGDPAAIRREFGSLRVVASQGTANRNDIPLEFVLADDAYRQVVHSPSVYSLVEAGYNFRSALVIRLRRADEALGRVVAELARAAQ